MSSNIGAYIPTNGLVFYYDMGNTVRSWKGAPITNLFSNPDMSNGASGYNAYVSATPVIVLSDNVPRTYGVSRNVLRCTSASAPGGGGTVGGLYFACPSTTAGVTYTISYWARSVNNSALTVSFSCQNGSGDENNLSHSKAITPNWVRYSYTVSLNVAKGSFYVYSNTANAVFDFADFQLEANGFASPFVNGSRSSTNIINDLSGQNTITANSLTYNSDNTFTFSGSSSLTVPFNSKLFTWDREQTINIWMTNQSTSATRRNPYNQAYAGGGTITHESDTGFNYYYGTGGGDNTPYTSLYSSFSVVQGETAMITLVRDPTNTSWYKNGSFSNSFSNPYPTVVTGTSNITIGSGYTTGMVGYIQAVQLYNRALSAQEVNQLYLAGKPRFFGYQSIVYTSSSSNITLTNNGSESVTMFKTAGSTGWNEQVYSTMFFTAPCTIEFTKQADSGDNSVSYAMIGWNTDPTADSNYTSLDYASYPFRTGGYEVYNNGSLMLNQSSGVTWETTKRFYIVYDTDGYIRHYNGAKLLYSVNYGTGNKVYVDSSFYSVNSTYGGFSDVRVCRQSWNGTSYV